MLSVNSIRIRYGKRIICHKDFITWLLSEKKAGAYLSQLIRITNSSENHTKCHNIMLESEFTELLNEVKHKERLYSMINGAFIAVNKPYLDDFKSNYSKLIALGIKFVDSIHRESLILTSPQKQTEFTSNSHIKNITNVHIKSGEFALAELNAMSKKFNITRDKLRFND